jgi:hypothetical protein
MKITWERFFIAQGCSWALAILVSIFADGAHQTDSLEITSLCLAAFAFLLISSNFFIAIVVLFRLTEEEVAE